MVGWHTSINIFRVERTKEMKKRESEMGKMNGTKAQSRIKDLCSLRHGFLGFFFVPGNIGITFFLFSQDIPQAETQSMDTQYYSK